MAYTPTEVEVERRLRMLVAAWAYAYEIKGESLVDDLEYDRTCLLIRPEIKTGHVAFDEFFEKEFKPDTGMWIYKHPDLPGVEKVYNRLKTKR